MKTISFALACAALYFATAGAQSEVQPVWDEVRSVEGNFIAWMPGQAKPSTSQEETKAGLITLNQYSVVVSNEIACFVSYSDMPEATWKGDPEKMLDGSVNGAVSRVKGTLLSVKKATLCRFPGRVFTVGVEGKMVLQQRVYLVRHRLYQINAGAITAKKDDAILAKFLDSFKLLDEGKALAE